MQYKLLLFVSLCFLQIQLCQSLKIDIEVDDSWTDDVSKGRAKLLDGLPKKSRPHGKAFSDGRRSLVGPGCKRRINMAFTLFLLFIACFPPISFIEATQNGCNTVMTSSSGSFSSPGYPGSYYDNTNCRYTIKMPQDKRIVLTVHGYSMESCCDVLDIFEAGQRIARLTGHHPFTNAHFVSNETQLDLQFTTDGSVIRGGFNASYYSFPAVGPYVIVAEVSTVRQNLSTGLSIAVLDFEPKAKRGHLSFRDLACGYMPSKTSYMMTELAVYNPLQRMLEAVIPMPTAFFGRVSVSGNLSLTISPLFETDIGRVFLCKLSYYANGYLREVESQRILVETGSWEKLEIEC
eukprot:Seg2195.8 transcript_id=Seg2195.8/GoldUCD/mRNA.D3Y31 product=Cubilin protein_id=Seg2195.8/GoldUCD/D3Y31